MHLGVVQGVIYEPSVRQIPLPPTHPTEELANGAVGKKLVTQVRNAGVSDQQIHERTVCLKI